MTNTTWNPSDKTAGITLSGSNLTATSSGSNQGVRAVDRQVTGQFYFELTVNLSNASTWIGLGTQYAPIASAALYSVVMTLSGIIWVNNASTGVTLGSRSSGDIIGIAVDLINNLIWFRVAPSGNWNGNASYAPNTGVGGVAFQSIGGGGIPLYPMIFFNASGNIVANFGDTSFSGTVPSGFTSGFTAGASIPTNALDTQSSIEQWTVPIPDMQFTQAAVEEWASAWPNINLTGLAGTGGVGSLSTVSAVPTPAFVLSGSRPGIGSVAVRDSASGQTNVLVGIGVESDPFISVSISSVSATGRVGTLASFPSKSINLTGRTATGGVGNLQLSISRSVTFTGVSATGNAGTLTTRSVAGGGMGFFFHAFP